MKGLVPNSQKDYGRQLKKVGEYNDQNIDYITQKKIQVRVYISK